MEKLTLKLTVTVTYDRHGTSKAELEELLHSAAKHLAEEGLLTSETEAEVNSWEEEVEEA